MTLLTQDDYLCDDVVSLAKSLIGKRLFTQFDGEKTGGMIIETEAYRGAEDKACHAYGMRRTKRTEVMFHRGGIAYIYLCYGMHNLLNIVTNQEDVPHAILIRALEPQVGIETMEKRRQGAKILTGGPGMVCQALGIDTSHNGSTLEKGKIWIEDRGDRPQFQAGPRIGVAYAKEDASLPYRFVVEKKLKN